MTTNRVAAYLDATAVSPEEAKKRAAAIMARFRESLAHMGGIDRADFLDMTNEDFSGIVRTLFYGRLAQ